MSYEALVDYFGTKKQYGCVWDGYTGVHDQFLVMRVGTGQNYLRTAPAYMYYRPLLYKFNGFKYGAYLPPEEFFVQLVKRPGALEEEMTFNQFVYNDQQVLCRRLSNFEIFKWMKRHHELKNLRQTTLSK